MNPRLISHVHDAHTDGDAIIYFTKNNVIHMGDTYFEGKFPYIDLSSGGNIDGYIAAAEKVIMLADEKTKIIPGHRNISNKKELIDFKSIIKKDIAKGKTLEQVKSNHQKIYFL